ncbi:MAG TPA: type II toxin-antitoxin system RelE/ParE family toxin [Myxococcales bacterium]
MIKYSRSALEDLDRLENTAPGALALVEEAVLLLDRHPLLGREIEQGLRELIISRGKTGYVALYFFDEQIDEVIVLAVQHQREAGYA